MLDDEIGTVSVVDGFSEGRLDLFRDVEIVEDGHLSVVLFHDTHFVWGYQAHIVFHLFIYGLVVHVDAVVSGVEQVAQQRHGPAGLLIYDLRSLCGLLYFGDGILPSFDERLELIVQLGHSFSFGRCSDDDAHVFGFDALEQLFQPGPFFALLDFRRYGDLVVEGHEHDITSREAQLAGQAGALGRDGFLHHLHEYLLSLVQRVLHASVLLQVGQFAGFADGEEVFAVAHHLFQVFLIRAELGAEVEVVQEGVFRVAYVNETGVKSGHQFPHFCHVDVAH